MQVDIGVESLLKDSEHLEQAGDIAGAISRVRQALSELGEVPEANPCWASLTARLGKLKFRLGDYPSAQKLASAALALAEEGSLAQVHACLLLGNCAAETSSLSEAEEHFQHVLELSIEYGYAELRSRALNSLAVAVYYPRGQLELAISAAQEAMSIIDRLDQPVLRWYPRSNLAFFYWLTGQPNQAQAMMADLAEHIYPGGLSEGYYLCTKALCAMEEGNLASVAADLHRAHGIADALFEPGLRVLVRIVLSRFALQIGDTSAAREWADDACQSAEWVHYLHFKGWALIERGRAAWEAGLCDQAGQDFQSAVNLLAPLDARYDLARAKLYLAVLALQAHLPVAEKAWKEAVELVTAGDYSILLLREQALIFPAIETALDSKNPEIVSLIHGLVTRLQKAPPPALKVYLLGDFQVQAGSRPVEMRALHQRRAGELLALLLCSPRRTLVFDQVSECLWPGRDPELTRTLFHHACSSLRQALEPGLPARLASRYLAIHGRQVTLVLPPGSQVDVDAFDQEYRSQNWQACLDLYRGEFLPDFAFSDWTQEYRQRLLQLVQDAMLARVEALAGEGRDHEVLVLCQRLLQNEPWHEAAALAGMKASMRLDDRSRAIQLYRSLAMALQNELGVTPSKELQSLYQQITH